MLRQKILQSLKPASVGLVFQPVREQALAASSQGPQIDIVHLINRHYSYTSVSKDNDFSRATVIQHWEDGLEDARRTITHPEWLEATNVADGIRQFDIAR